MKIWPHILCSLIVLGRVVVGEQPQCRTDENPRSGKFILDESSWDLMLEGEWMVGFCVPLIMACIKFDRMWNKFAQEVLLVNSSLKVASMKLEYSEAVIRRFSLQDLPTILHVKNGTFRKLPVAQSVEELKELALTKWQLTDPMPFWQHPNGLLINAFLRYIHAIDIVYHTGWLNTDYEHAAWLVRIGLVLILAMIVTAICGVYTFVRDQRQTRKRAPNEQTILAKGQPVYIKKEVH